MRWDRTAERIFVYQSAIAARERTDLRADSGGKFNETERIVGQRVDCCSLKLIAPYLVGYR